MSDRYWRDPNTCGWVLCWDRFALLLLISTLIVLIGCQQPPSFLTPPPSPPPHIVIPPQPIITPAPNVNVHIAPPAIAEHSSPVINVPAPTVVTVQPQVQPATPEPSIEPRKETDREFIERVAPGGNAEPAVVEIAQQPELKPEPDPLFSPAHLLPARPTAPRFDPANVVAANMPAAVIVEEKGEPPHSNKVEVHSVDPAESLQPPAPDVASPPATRSRGRTILMTIATIAAFFGYKYFKARFSPPPPPDAEHVESPPAESTSDVPLVAATVASPEAGTSNSES